MIRSLTIQISSTSGVGPQVELEVVFSRWDQFDSPDTQRPEFQYAVRVPGFATGTDSDGTIAYGHDLRLGSGSGIDHVKAMVCLLEFLAADGEKYRAQLSQTSDTSAEAVQRRTGDSYMFNEETADLAYELAEELYLAADELEDDEEEPSTPGELVMLRGGGHALSGLPLRVAPCSTVQCAVPGYEDRSATFANDDLQPYTGPAPDPENAYFFVVPETGDDEPEPPADEPELPARGEVEVLTDDGAGGVAHSPHCECAQCLAPDEDEPLTCPRCGGTNVTPPHGHHLAKCDSCHLAFDTMDDDDDEPDPRLSEPEESRSRPKFLDRSEWYAVQRRYTASSAASHHSRMEVGIWGDVVQNIGEAEMRKQFEWGARGGRTDEGIDVPPLTKVLNCDERLVRVVRGRTVEVLDEELLEPRRVIALHETPDGGRWLIRRYEQPHAGSFRGAAGDLDAIQLNGIGLSPVYASDELDELREWCDTQRRAKSSCSCETGVRERAQYGNVHTDEEGR